MSLRPRANEISGLVARLGSRRQIDVDAAIARLSVIGPRAVEALIEGLDDDETHVRRHAMRLLAMIRDPRGREPLEAMLLDTDPKLRDSAARCLARFPSRESVAALERMLRREKNPEVRVAAVESLSEMFGAGEEAALAPVLAVLLDPDEGFAPRRAGFAVLPRLSAAQRRGLLRRLEQDPALEIATFARGDGETGGSHGAEPPSLEVLLVELGSADYSVWDGAVQKLVAVGSAVVDPLVEAMLRRADDPEYNTRAGMVLRAIGPRRGRGVVEWLERVDDPLPLQVLVETIGAYGVHALTYRLKDLLERLAEADRDRSRPESGGVEPRQRVRAKAHLELARIGSRVAIADLREALADRSRRLELELLAALERIGKRDELPDLLRAWRREEPFVRERIAVAVRAVLRRERIRRNSAVLRALPDELRAALDELLGGAPRLTVVERR